MRGGRHPPPPTPPRFQKGGRKATFFLPLLLLLPILLLLLLPFLGGGATIHSSMTKLAARERRDILPIPPSHGWRLKCWRDTPPRPPLQKHLSCRKFFSARVKSDDDGRQQLGWRQGYRKKVVPSSMYDVRRTLLYYSTSSKFARRKSDWEAGVVAYIQCEPSLSSNGNTCLNCLIFSPY